MERMHYKGAHLGGYALPCHPSQPLVPDGEDRARGVGRQRLEGFHITRELKKRAAGRQGRGLYQPNDTVTQEPQDAMKRGTTKKDTPGLRIRSRYSTLLD